MGKFYFRTSSMSAPFLLTSVIAISLFFPSSGAAASVAAVCQILDITAGDPVCKGDGTYDIDLTVLNNGEGVATGNLVLVTGETRFEVPAAPDTNQQQVTINLPYDGEPVGITAYFSDGPDCKLEKPALFVSPEGCSSIGDYLWEDANGNGVQDGAETGLPGWTIELQDCFGNIIDQAVTDPDGYFLFRYLPSGDYRIAVPLPNDGKFYEYADYRQGSLGAADNDLRANGTSDCLSLAPEEERVDIDGGMLICPASVPLVCNNALNVPLQDGCQLKITPDMLLEGELFCQSSFEVRLFDDTGFIGNIVTNDQIGKTITAFVVNKQNENNVCSTELTVIDIVAPEINCEERVDQASVPKQAQVSAGEIQESDATFETIGFTCWLDDANGLAGSAPHHYDAQGFRVSEDDYYNLVLFTDWGDGVAVAVEGDFDDFNPCSNTLAFGATAPDEESGLDLYDGFGPDLEAWITPGMEPALQLSLPLRKGRTYHLVTSTYDPAARGNYVWAVFSDREGRWLPVSGDPFPTITGTVHLDLICTDFDSLFNKIPSLGYLGFPEVSDNCSEITDLEFTDVIQRKSVCGPVIVDRNFQATDDSGNASYCLQEISIRKPGPDDIILPTATVFLDCDDELVYDENGNPHPDVTGHPLIWTAYGVMRVDVPFCNIVADYSDEIRVDICEGGYTIRREWTIIDWCNVARTIIYNQIINVGDKKGPEIDLSGLNGNGYSYPDTLRYSTGPFDCTGAFEVPLPGFSDNCSENSEIEIEVVSVREVPVFDSGIPVGTRLDTQVVFTVPSGVYPVVSDIPMGCYWLRYVVTDNCNNESTALYPVCVEDQVEPVVICADDISISIGGQGAARLFAESVDQGSFDACEIDRVEIRRELNYDADCTAQELSYSEYGPFVDFSCCDVGNQVSIELRVTDQWGNSNSCWLQVSVEDKIAPQCTIAESIEVSCTDLPYDFDPTNKQQLQELFGTPEGIDNCSIESFSEFDPILELDDCGFGEITRRFRVMDIAGNESSTCRQKVNILPVFNYEIKFPADVEVTCGAVEPDTLVYNNSGCDLLAVKVEDETFTSAQDACFKIFRTYTVINWCEYDELSDPVVIGRDEDCDRNIGDEDIWLLRRPDTAYLDRDTDELNEVPLFGTRGTTCDGETNPEGYWRGVTPSGYWMYTQVIEVVDRDVPELVFEEPSPFCSEDSEHCTGAVAVRFQLRETCTPETVLVSALFDQNNDTIPDREVSVAGSYPDYEIAGEFAIGEHAFELLVEDGCGNRQSYRLPFSIVDCKAPSVICMAGLAATLQLVPGEKDLDGDGIVDRGMAIVRALDFVASAGIDCSGGLRYSINRVGEMPVLEQDSLLLLCADSMRAEVEIYAWDTADNPTAIQPDGSIGGPNYNFCTAMVDIADPQGLCRSTSGAISGRITTPEDQRVAGVEIKLRGEDEQIIVTEPNGVYAFEELFEGVDYTITPYLDDRHNNGVSTFDIIIISRHILGVTPFDSPYKIIAADADNSHTVSTLDLIKLRKLILGIEDRLEFNTSWRFVDASYEFPFADDPWFEDFPEVATIKGLAGISEDMDFMAVKIGDVNESASLINTTNLAGEETIDPRSLPGDWFEIETDDRSLVAGESVVVDFRVRQLNRVQGFQFTLAFEPSKLEFLELEHGLLGEQHLGRRHIGRGMITASWHQGGAGISDERSMCRVRFRAHRSGRLSQLLEVNSRITAAEAYEKSGRHIGVALAFKEDDSPGRSFVLEQNYPNPAQAQTQIRFRLPADDEIVLKIFNSRGKLIRRFKGIFEAGENVIFLDCRSLPEGILTYLLETSEFQAVKKMVVVR